MQPANIVFLLLVFYFSSNTSFAKSEGLDVKCINNMFSSGSKSSCIWENTSGDNHTIFFASNNPDKDSSFGEKLKRKARLANTLGIASLVGVFIPFVNILSIPAAITAIVIGNQVKKQAVDLIVKRQASKGVIAGWIALALIAILGYFITRLYYTTM